MDFNTIIKERLGPTFTKHGFLVEDYAHNFVKFKSQTIEVAISCDDREKGCIISIGRLNEFLWPIDSFVIQYLFGDDLKMNFFSIEEFVSGLLLLFQKGFNPLLNGDIEMIHLIKNYVEKRSKDYTQGIINKQKLQLANAAWAKGDYVRFIEIMSKIDALQWSNTDKFRHNIAVKKLSL